MMKWYVVFDDDPDKVNARQVDEGELRADALARFDSLAAAGEIGGREIRGMWLVDHEGGAKAVIRTHGVTPNEINSPAAPVASAASESPPAAPTRQLGEARGRPARPKFGRR